MDRSSARGPSPARPRQAPTHLLNSGSFSRSSRAEWLLIRVRSNCAISSGKVLPIWFSVREAGPAPQLAPSFPLPLRPTPTFNPEGG